MGVQSKFKVIGLNSNTTLELLSGEAVAMAIIFACVLSGTGSEFMTVKSMEPVHPGEILWEEFLKPLNITQYRLAKDINVPPRRVNEIVHGKRAITADTALRLSHYFGLSERFWLNLQARYDLETEKERLKGRIQDEVKVLERQSA